VIKAMLGSALRWCKYLWVAAALAAAGGCATTNGDARDPFEGFNRAMYGFNQSVDAAVLKPVATAYREGLPEIVQTGIRNFFSNIADIFISVNNLLQGKVIDAASDTMRFTLNTLFGGLGVLDWGSEIGLEKHNEDFGQTFGRWGVGPGAYIVWPLLGSSTVRDSVGGAIDVYVDPVSRHEPIAARNALVVTRAVGKRADLLDASRLLEEAALDKYVFERDAYLQRRRNLIYDGSPPREPVPSSMLPQPAPGGIGDPDDETKAAGKPLAPEIRTTYEPSVPRNYEAVLAKSAREIRPHAENN